MDIEQLKLILETLNKLGESSLIVAVIWIFIDSVIPTMGWLLSLYLIVSTVRYAFRLNFEKEVDNEIEKREREALVKLCSEMNVKSWAVEPIKECLEKLKNWVPK